MNIEKQTELWVNGLSIHNEDSDECCPDFSCCRPHLIAPIEERLSFQHAVLMGDEKTKNSLLMVFLSRMLTDQGFKVMNWRKKVKYE